MGSTLSLSAPFERFSSLTAAAVQRMAAKHKDERYEFAIGASDTAGLLVSADPTLTPSKAREWGAAIVKALSLTSGGNHGARINALSLITGATVVAGGDFDMDETACALFDVL